VRVLLIDQDRVGLDFALRAAASGHQVKWFRFCKKPCRDGEGFKQIEIVENYKDSLTWAKSGLIFVTGNAKYIPEMDRLRDFGFPIFAPSVKSSELEIKRSLGMEALEKLGIDVPHYETFTSLADAAKFARKADQGYVFKCMGSEEDKSLTYVSCDPGDLVGWIERKIKMGVKLKGPCMLQEKIDMLCDYGVSGWFGPDGFLPDKWQIAFEHKKLMNGEKGPQTGEMMTLTQYCEKEKLADDMLKPLEPLLKKLGHRGDFAIGVGIDQKGKAWPFEFTVRIGVPAIYNQIASHFGDPAKWMKDLLDGKDSLKVSYDVALSVVCAQPLFPYDDEPSDLNTGNPIYGIDEVHDQVHLVSVMREKGPLFKGGKVTDEEIYKTTGAYVLVATGLGKTIESARKEVYAAVDEIKFKDSMYRTDGGEKVKPILKDLHKHGYALQMEPGS
jgi:phosphoribosylamine---glycine ligase